MSTIKIEKGCKLLDTTPQEIRVRVWESGKIDIRAYNLKSKTLEAISELTGVPIKEGSSSRWVAFARARDGSKVVLFEE